MKLDLVTRIVSKKAGRLEAVQKAWANQELNQPGLMEALADSVEDRYHDFAEFVTRRVLPMYGTLVVPHLVRNFSPSGKIADIRRLKLVSRIDPDEGRKLARLCLKSSHRDLVREVLWALRESEPDVDYLLKKTKDLDRSIRSLAFRALRGIHTEFVIKTVMDAFVGGALEASSAMAIFPYPQYTEYCAEFLDKFAKFIEKEGVPTEQELERLFSTIRAVFGHGGSTLDEILFNWTGLVTSGTLQRSSNSILMDDCVRNLMNAVAISPVPKAQRLLIERRNSVNHSRRVFPMCAASWHDDLCLFELFCDQLPYESKSHRCKGWWCMAGSNWPCSLLSAVEFALRDDFNTPDYEGNTLPEGAARLIHRIRREPRWIEAVQRALRLVR